MSKALVIKGANFNVNKLEVVHLVNAVPCTGITLSQSSIAIDGIDVSNTIIANPIPSDTTDTVIWSSSDESVAEVSQSGVITSKGVGSATITATCGTCSASCNVTVSVTLNANTEYTRLNGWCITDMDLSANPPKDCCRATAGDRYALYYSDENVLGGLLAFGEYRSGTKAWTFSAYPIPIPSGTSKITIQFPTGVKMFQCGLTNSQEPCTIFTDTRQCSKLIQGYNIDTSTFPSDGRIVIDNVEEVDSFVFGFGVPSGATAASITGDVTVTFE